LCKRIISEDKKKRKRKERRGESEDRYGIDSRDRRMTQE
jgi:hypothetical protein